MYEGISAAKLTLKRLGPFLNRHSTLDTFHRFSILLFLAILFFAFWHDISVLVKILKKKMEKMQERAPRFVYDDMSS